MDLPRSRPKTGVQTMLHVADRFLASCTYLTTDSGSSMPVQSDSFVLRGSTGLGTTIARMSSNWIAGISALECQGVQPWQSLDAFPTLSDRPARHPIAHASHADLP
jgi:hypothetical protein